MGIDPEEHDRDIISIHNPADGSIVGTIPLGTAADVTRSVDTAQKAFVSWSRTEPVDRAKILFTAAQKVRADSKRLATLLTREQGKPLRESTNEIAGFARVLEYYASISGLMRGDYAKSSSYGHMMVARKPIGVCAAIIPWNMPALIMAWKVGPALAAGNAIIVKPATTAPLTCIELAKHLEAAGSPKGVISLVTGPGEVVGEALARDPGIRHLSFTGAVETGVRVSTLAAPTLKRLVLELGGSDAMIVCRDADLDLAAKGAVSGRFFNCGQTCTAIKRVFVDEKVGEPFINKVTELTRRLKPGDGLSDGVDIGPLHTASQRERIMSLLQDTVDTDAGKVLTGGQIPKDETFRSGNFFNPTVLSEVSSDTPIMHEEVFGPVLPVASYDTLDDAICQANSTRYGLGASVWTHDSRIISRACEELDAGIIWVNQHLRIPPEVPFGGVKASGLGRENGRYALEEYLEEKTVLINP